MKVIELFSGIGAPRMALKKLNIEHEVIGISEIEDKTIKAYESIHGTTLNFGDITKIEHLPPCDLLHASSPCQSFSSCGKRDGLNGESGLLLEVIRLLKDYKERNELPNYFSFENVPDLKLKFFSVYKMFVDFLKEIGYNVYDAILNAGCFDNPQKRERLFIIGINNTIDNHSFKMPQNNNQTKLRLKDILEPRERVEEKYIHEPYRFEHRHIRTTPFPSNTFQTIEEGYFFTKTSEKRSQSNRIYSKEGLCPTITTVPCTNVLEEDCVRKVMPIEYWKAMGFNEEDYKKVEGTVAKTHLQKMIGNSIALGPITAIYKNLFL